MANSLKTEALSKLTEATEMEDANIMPVVTASDNLLKKITWTKLKECIENVIYGKNYRKMGKFTSGAFNLDAEVTKQVDISISVPKVPNAVIAIPRGGSPFMVSVVATSSVSSVRVACKSTKTLTNRTLDVIVFY